MLYDELREEMIISYFMNIQKYIVKSCITLVSDFKENKRFIPDDENKIRNALLEEYLNDDEHKNENKMESYRFIPEVQENYDKTTFTYSGRVDIKVLLGNDFNDSNSYFVIECKRLDGKPYLSKKFVTEGIDRFISFKYKSLLNYSTMLGFVTNKNNVMKTLYDTIVDYQQENDYESYEYKEAKVYQSYLTALRKFETKKVNINYILFDFSEVINIE